MCSKFDVVANKPLQIVLLLLLAGNFVLQFGLIIMVKLSAEDGFHVICTRISHYFLCVKNEIET